MFIRRNKFAVVLEAVLIAVIFILIFDPLGVILLADGVTYVFLLTSLIFFVRFIENYKDLSNLILFILFLYTGYQC